MSIQEKYLKYKKKYLNLQNSIWWNINMSSLYPFSDKSRT